MSKQYRILIVDDEPGIRSAVGSWFTAKGFLVDTAADGIEAMEKCRACAYDLVTMDLEMPRMGGLEAIPAIKALYPTLPIVVLTGYVKNEESALSAGAARVLAKPLRLSHLEQEVRSVLSLA
jgi:CheY-like chemotaxis protein